MKHLTLLVLLPFFSCLSFAQDTRQLSISVMTESMAFPFTRYDPIHPGMEVGYTVHKNDKTRVTKAINVYLGWYFHRKVENAFYMRAESAWQIKIKDHLGIDLFSGLGYMHVFYPGEVYELNNSTGNFEKINQTGRPHLLGSIGLGFSYRNKSNWQPFIRQDLGIETPFANGIPIMVHSFLKAGAQIKINKN